MANIYIILANEHKGYRNNNVYIRWVYFAHAFDPFLARNLETHCQLRHKLGYFRIAKEEFCKHCVFLLYSCSNCQLFLF